MTAANTAFSQEKKIVRCDVKNKELSSVKYYVGFLYNSINPKKELIINIAVESKLINASDLELIAKHLKERFCNNSRLVVLIFDNKKIADNFDTTFKSARDSLRGEYVLNKDDEEEYLSFVKIPNYFENPDNRIKIDLSAKNKNKSVKNK